MPAIETSRKKIVARLKREGWQETHGGSHDKFKHSGKPGRIIVPRHSTLSPGVAREIAAIAGWSDE
jgi:predicted RNA binding protein YcfA (HicA-like mRNA interferase family)